MIIEVLQLLNSQKQKTGHWQLTARTEEHSEPHGLCTHVHNSSDEAWNCLDAWALAKKLEDSP